MSERSCLILDGAAFGVEHYTSTDRALLSVVVCVMGCWGGMMGGSGNTQKNLGSEVKLALRSNPCLSALGELFNLSLSFPTTKKGTGSIRHKG